MTMARQTRDGTEESAGADATRRTEILQTANAVIASSGLRASVQQIADAAGILAGSLYHHFESKEAILVELIRRYHADLDRIGDQALERLDQPDPPPAEDLITLWVKPSRDARSNTVPHCRCRSSRDPAPTLNSRP